MNDSAIQRLILGIALLVVGVILLLVAAWWTYDGTMRWRATSALMESRRSEFLGRERNATEQAQRAATYQRQLATSLANFDPLADNAEIQLNTIQRNLAQPNRHLSLVREYVEVMAGKSGSISSPGSNGSMLQALQEYLALSQGPVPELPSTSDDIDPGLLQRAIEWRLRKAWELDDRQALRDTSGQLAMLYPRHPAAPYARIIAAFAGDEVRPADVRRLTRDSDTPNKAVRAAVLRAVGRMWPRHQATIQELIPSDLRTGAELINTMIAEQAPPINIVREAIRTRNDEILRSVASYCLRLGRLDLVENLAAQGSDEFKSLAQAIVAERRLDLETLRKLGVNTEDVTPQAFLLHSGRDWLSFHLSDRHGRIPTADIAIYLGGEAVDPDSVRRVGSLVWLPAPGPNRIVFELRKGKDVLFSQELLR